MRKKYLANDQNYPVSYFIALSSKNLSVQFNQILSLLGQSSTAVKIFWRLLIFEFFVFSLYNSTAENMKV